MIYLIEYDRAAGQLVRLQDFRPDRRGDAERQRLEIELASIGAGSREIVLLEADSEAALRRTHRRYFERLDQLLQAPARIVS